MDGLGDVSFVNNLGLFPLIDFFSSSSTPFILHTLFLNATGRSYGQAQAPHRRGGSHHRTWDHAKGGPWRLRCHNGGLSGQQLAVALPQPAPCIMASAPVVVMSYQSLLHHTATQTLFTSRKP